MVFKIRPAVEADVLTLVSMDLTANTHHPMITLAWLTPEARHSFLLDRAKSMLQLPLHHVVVATDADGEIAGYIGWRTSRETSGETTEWKPDLPEGANKKVFAAWEPTQAAKARLGFAGLAEVISLSVSPSYQKQGVGTSLVKACIEHLDKNHEDCGVFASVLGRRLYENFGFKDLGETRTDFSEFGGKVHLNYIMKRNATEQ